jgi:multiple sugar transport system ATP-binding protein
VARIQLVGVTRRHPDGSEPVAGVDLDVADGELLVLAGPPGAGKSTLLRMVVGLDEITDGDLLIDGERANDWAPRERDLAMVFQSYSLYPHLSVRENIAFPLRLARAPEDEVRRRVEEAAGILELTQHLDRRPNQLTGAQRQRVATGRVIVRRPRAFLLDEPLSALDPALRVRLRTAIARLQERLRVTTLYATGDQGEAMTLGHRVAVLRGGRVQQVDTPQRLYEHPANLFVAGFLGSPPMNLLPARVDGAALRLPTVEVPLPPAAAERLAGRERVVAGVRPEHFEDAALVGEERAARGVVFAARVEGVDWTGSELYAYLRYRDDGALAGPLAALARDLHAERADSVLVARLDPASDVRGRPVARVWMDSGRLLVFDPETGRFLVRLGDEG